VSASEIINSLRAQNKKLIFAESITGGLLVDAFISVPGASDVVLGSEVTYASDLKSALLGVDETLLEAEGAVNREVAIQMAKGAAAVAQGATDLSAETIFAVSTTGNAGPDAQGGQPVGKAFVAVVHGTRTKAIELSLTGSRLEIRQAVVEAAIHLLGEQLAH
jgi:nicotinamide-nucleotide amidase